MILYNVTVKVDRTVAADWLNWMQEVHIPEVMMTNQFIEYRLMRILGEVEDDGVTYAIQYLCASIEKFRKYHDDFAKRLQAEHSKRYKDRFVAFRTLMEMVDHNSRNISSEEMGSS